LNKEHSLTLEEIGERFNLTRERVRQIKEKAIRRLRTPHVVKILKLISDSFVNRKIIVFLLTAGILLITGCSSINQSTRYSKNPKTEKNPKQICVTKMEKKRHKFLLQMIHC